MNIFQRSFRIVAAIAFATTASAATLVTQATNAGQPAQGLLSSAPQAASAAVFVRVGFGGPNRYARFVYRGGAWQRFGFAYASAPGYVGGYYVGYGPPAPAYHPYWHPFYGHPFYGHPYYGHPFYGHVWYRGGWRR